MVCVSALWCLSQHLPSYLGFSYLGRGVSLHAAPAKCSLCSLPWTRGISSQPPLLTLFWRSHSYPSECRATSFHSKVRGTAGMHRTRFKELLMQAAQNIGLERLYRLSELLLVTQICLHRLRKCHGKLFNFKELFFFFNKISFYFILII